MQRRDPIISLILTIVTCGIYGLYWVYKMTNESCKREEMRQRGAHTSFA